MPAKLKSGSRNHRVALVLQGGGALGAYQAGIYQGLQEHGMTPDWVVGTSIGAVNAALIAGNRPEDRVAKLEKFWNDVAARTDLFDMRLVSDQARRINTWFSTINVVANGIPGFFSPRLFSPFILGLEVEPEQASFYDTSGLLNTMQRLVDFNYLNSNEAMRLTVSAVQVTNGDLHNFDSNEMKIHVDHVMASCSLPPAFSPVRIDGKLYWDGGLYSNTPLSAVLDDEPRFDTLCFMVDLWNAKGAEPKTLSQVRTRVKDVTYASRSKRHIDSYIEIHALRHSIRALHDRLPPELKRESDLEELAAMGSASVMHIVHLGYGGRDWNRSSKDINFSSGSIQWRWEQGYRDATRAMEQHCWVEPVSSLTGVVVHDPKLHR